MTADNKHLGAWAGLTEFLAAGIRGSAQEYSWPVVEICRTGSKQRHICSNASDGLCQPWQLDSVVMGQSGGIQ